VFTKNFAGTQNLLNSSSSRPRISFHKPPHLPEGWARSHVPKDMVSDILQIEFKDPGISGMENARLILWSLCFIVGSILPPLFVYRQHFVLFDERQIGAFSHIDCFPTASDVRFFLLGLIAD